MMYDLHLHFKNSLHLFESLSSVRHCLGPERAVFAKTSHVQAFVEPTFWSEEKHTPNMGEGTSRMRQHSGCSESTKADGVLGKALLGNVFAVDAQVTKRSSTLGRSKGRAFHLKSGICGFPVACLGAERRQVCWTSEAVK